MKLRELVFAAHGTSFVLNFTHPEPVCITLLSCGVGSCGSLLTGGVNTTDTRSPTKNPTNNQNTENILIYVISQDCRVSST
jgi:hypothetical protein